MFGVSVKRPPALKKGDRVRLIAPASPFNRQGLRRGQRVLERLGYRWVIDPAEFQKKGFLTGSDDQRARRLEQALLEKDTSAVWCIRGGYGSARVLSQLDLRLIRRRPKVLIGFSDVTALLLSLASPGGYVTFHGPVVTQLAGVPKSTLDWLARLTSEPRAVGKAPLGRLKTVVKGKTNGFLLGGNLAIMSSLVGTPFLPPLAGAILCLEDTGEEAYRLDRMFWQLWQSGVLKNVFGVVIGSLSGCRPTGGGALGARSVLERAAAQLGVPAVSGADFGHLGRNVALPMGVLARLDASRGSLTILEPAVRDAGIQPPVSLIRGSLS